MCIERKNYDSQHNTDLTPNCEKKEGQTHGIHASIQDVQFVTRIWQKKNNKQHIRLACSVFFTCRGILDIMTSEEEARNL